MKTLKMVLIVLGILAGFVVLSSLGLYYWFNSKKAELLAMGQKAQSEGTAFGTGKNGETCVAEAIRRTDECDGMTCEIETKLFFKSCLKSASPAVACTDVPDPNEIIAGAQWTVQKCRVSAKKNAEGCTRVVREVQEFCHPK